MPGMSNEANGERLRVPPTLTSTISAQFLFNHRGDEDDEDDDLTSIDENEAVIFLNPCSYTLEYDFKKSEQQNEVSAFDPDVIEEESLIANAPLNRDQLYSQIKDGTH